MLDYPALKVIHDPAKPHHGHSPRKTEDGENTLERYWLTEAYLFLGMPSELYWFWAEDLKLRKVASEFEVLNASATDILAKLRRAGFESKAQGNVNHSLPDAGQVGHSQLADGRKNDFTPSPEKGPKHGLSEGIDLTDTGLARWLTEIHRRIDPAHSPGTVQASHLPKEEGQFSGTSSAVIPGRADSRRQRLAWLPWLWPAMGTFCLSFAMTVGLLAFGLSRWDFFRVAGVVGLVGLASVLLGGKPLRSKRAQARLRKR